MGILDKLKNKVADAMEKSASTHLSGASKEAYEKEKAQVKTAVETPSLPAPYPFEKEALKDLPSLMTASSLCDPSDHWCAGFPNFKANQNARAANLFSGKKNLRFLCAYQGYFLLLKLEDDQLVPYEAFNQSMVRQAKVESKLLSKSLRIEFHKGHVFTIEVTENKPLADKLIAALTK